MKRSCRRCEACSRGWLGQRANHCGRDFFQKAIHQKKEKRQAFKCILTIIRRSRYSVESLRFGLSAVAVVFSAVAAQIAGANPAHLGELLRDGLLPAAAAKDLVLHLTRQLIVDADLAKPLVPLGTKMATMPGNDSLQYYRPSSPKSFIIDTKERP